MAEKKTKNKIINGKCDYCNNEAEAMVRTKKLCEMHWWKFKRGDLFIPLIQNV